MSPTLSQSPKIVVMGVSGSGKTEVARQLAAALGAAFIEGDSFHAPASREKMRAGVPLTDEDRWAWLDALSAACRAQVSGPGFVLACSALRRAYRDRLRAALPGLYFVFLDASGEVVADRVASRPDHFMPVSLVESQLATLESPLGEPDALHVSADQPLEQVVAQSLAGVCRHYAPGSAPGHSAGQGSGAAANTSIKEALQ